MDLESILQQFVNLAGTFSPSLMVFLFVICALGEFHIAIPYVLETIWLLSGYHAGSGVLSPLQLLLLWLAAQAGRQAGATLLFFLTRWGSMPLKRLYQKYVNANPEKVLESNSLPFRLWRRMEYLSPLSVATGRLFWLRIPLTITLGVQRRLKALCLGVMLSGLVWDGIYIVLGIIGGHVVLRPVEMVLYSLIGLTLLYAVTIAVRQLRRRRNTLSPK